MFHVIKIKQIEATFKEFMILFKGNLIIQDRLEALRLDTISTFGIADPEVRLVAYADSMTALTRFFNTQLILIAIQDNDTLYNSLLDRVVWLRGSVIHPKFTLLQQWRKLNAFEEVPWDTLNWIAEELVRLNNKWPVAILDQGVVTKLFTLKFLAALNDLSKQNITVLLEGWWKKLMQGKIK